MLVSINQRCKDTTDAMIMLLPVGFLAVRLDGLHDR